MMKPSVSVIVPVYNTAAFLRRCVDSLRTQTLQDIEILLIDDGSGDGSGRICDEYAAADSRIRVVHQENAGLSGARNTGIGLAEGEYFMFVDSDDWVEPDFCRIPLTIAGEQHADLVIFQFRRFCGGREKKRKLTVPGGVKTTGEALRLLTREAEMAAWNKLYRRSLFQTRRYPVGRVFEDVMLTPELVHEARRIVYAPVFLYNHAYRRGSITTELSERNEQDWIDAKQSVVQRLESWGFEREAEEYRTSSMLCFIGRERFHPALREHCISLLRRLRRCPPGFSAKQRLLFCLFRFSPALFKRVYKLRIGLRS